ncbi:Gfo/Idh/MocA family oxidoreductase [Prosthecomicrobium pneumaticum]|uniref:Putative dehydrogenase n=1 Tax=Prosthecomicrobium pneumaticum TaxID=81895 RepID=A0A7W9FM24_9HYPH|nr:putative dehydrogenase [Prosthecomicrobium pneumaticum]
MSQTLRVGIVGCGEVAQTIHIPGLLQLHDLFTITALCDVSPRVLSAVGARLPDAERFLDHRELVESAAVDVVLVANPHVYHAPVAIDAMRAGKHVLIEKPMCVTLAEADALAEAEARYGVTAQIGFMRRYAPAFTEAVEHVSKIRGDIILARVHDVIGPNARIIDSTSTVIRGTDLPDSLIERTKAAMAASVEAAIGIGEGPVAVAYNLLLGLSSHDISAMRELIGLPKAVLHATQRKGGRVLTGTFDYGDFVCQFETGVDQIAHFDAHLEVYTPTEIVRVDYDTPYVRNQPARMSVIRSHGPAGIAATTSYPTRGDSFVVEWRAFHDNVTAKKTPKTTIADARDDLELFRAMIRLMA